MTKIKILFLAANPKGTMQLALDEEIREITYKIRLSEGRDLLDIVSAWAVRPDDLLQYLNQYKPQVVHFSGHGSEAGEIILVDNDGNTKPVSPQALTTLFTTLKDNIQIVVLNACYSRVQGKAINKVIDYVIGMNKAIGDRAAIVFAASLYRALGFNRTIQEAFDQARAALLLEGIPEENTPELLIRRGISQSKKNPRAKRVTSSLPHIPFSKTLATINTNNKWLIHFGLTKGINHDNTVSWTIDFLLEEKIDNEMRTRINTHFNVDKNQQRKAEELISDKLNESQIAYLTGPVFYSARRLLDGETRNEELGKLLMRILTMKSTV